VAEHYASGDWHVTKGKEKEFVQAWTDFLEWTRKTQPGLTRATLTKDAKDPNHFMSLSEWEDTKARDAWRNAPEFQGLFMAARSLCDEMSNSDYEQTVSI